MGAAPCTLSLNHFRESTNFHTSEQMQENENGLKMKPSNDRHGLHAFDSVYMYILCTYYNGVESHLILLKSALEWGGHRIQYEYKSPFPWRSLYILYTISSVSSLQDTCFTYTIFLSWDKSDD